MKRKWTEKWDFPLVPYWPHVNCLFGFTYVAGSSGTLMKHPFWARGQHGTHGQFRGPIFSLIYNSDGSHGSQMGSRVQMLAWYLSNWPLVPGLERRHTSVLLFLLLMILLSTSELSELTRRFPLWHEKYTFSVKHSLHKVQFLVLSAAWHRPTTPALTVFQPVVVVVVTCWWWSSVIIFQLLSNWIYGVKFMWTKSPKITL